MSDYIKNQLKKCVWADLKNYDPNTNIYHIKKYSKPSYLKGSCYIIKVPAEIVNNKTTVLAVNWNNGSCPKNQYLKAFVSETMGTYIYVDTLPADPITKQEISSDLSAVWSGWLDTNTLEQICQVM